MFKFPDVKPSVEPDMHGWFDNHNKTFLKDIIKDDFHTIIELGAWLGKSTRWLCDNSNAKIFSVDHWKGSIEHMGRKDVSKKLENLYETFIVNCWDYKDRIVPIKTDTITGLYWCKDMDIEPNMIFIDASHEYEDVYKDIETSHKLFPSAIIVGDDWSWRNRRVHKKFTVREAVQDFSINHKFKVSNNDRCWRIIK